MIYLELFLTFFMIGAVTFGGGYAMLPMIQEQVALRWGDIISSESLINFVAVSESTPGPFAVNMATYVGSAVGGQNGGAGLVIFGAFCATLGVVLPSFIIILIVAKCYDKFRESKVVKGCMSGLKPAVIGLILSAVISLGKPVFFPVKVSLSVLSTPAFYVSLVIFIVSLVTVLKMKKLSPIYIIVGSALLGVAAGYIFNIPV
jgi:chromate transporter